MVGGAQGCWVRGGGDYIFFSRGGRGGAEHYYFVCIPIHSYVFGKKKLKPNSFVCLPIHSYVFPPKRSLNPNSFVCLQIHSYIFQKKNCISIPSSVFQFIRMSSNSFVCLLGGDGGWRAGMVGGGGGERLYLFIFSRGGGGRGTLLFCVYSNAFVCLPIHSYVFGKKLKPNSFVCLPIHGIGWGYPPEPLLLFRGNNNNESISIHYYPESRNLVILVAR